MQHEPKRQLFDPAREIQTASQAFRLSFHFSIIKKNTPP